MENQICNIHDLIVTECEVSEWLARKWIINNESESQVLQKKHNK